MCLHHVNSDINDNIMLTSAIYKHSISNNHPKANISHFKIIDEISSTTFLEQTDLQMSLTKQQVLQTSVFDN